MGEKPPRVTFFDVENAPSLGYFYDPYRENNIVATKQSWFMLSFAWKAPKEKATHCKGLIDYPGYRKDKTSDESLVRDLHKVFSESDILVGHNIDRFDIRKANSRFLFWGLPPCAPRKTVDTLKIARRVFFQDSNKLGALTDFLGLGNKLPTNGWDTWQGCIEGDRKSWDLLKRYNKVDVIRTESLWEKLAPWLPNHPLMRALDTPGCNVCQSHNVQHRGFNIAKTKRTPRLQCRDCGHWFTGKAISK